MRSLWSAARPLTRRLAISAVLLALIFFAGGIHRASADTYLIQPGDTLSEIADRLQVELSVLLALNSDIASPNSIYVGQEIRIPDNAAPAPPPAEATETQEVEATVDADPAETVTYVIEEGDTLGDIAEAHNTTVAEIAALNPGLNTELLWVGTEIVVPASATSTPTESSSDGSRALNAGVRASAPLPVQTIAYTVQPGDAFSHIADAHGLTVDDLMPHNSHLNLPTIHPGEIVYIPIPDHRAPALDPQDAQDRVTERYYVRSGDSASAIAARFNITLTQLGALNDGVDLSMIFINQALNVPWDRHNPRSRRRHRASRRLAPSDLQGPTRRHFQPSRQSARINPGSIARRESVATPRPAGDRRAPLPAGRDPPARCCRVAHTALGRHRPVRGRNARRHAAHAAR